MKNNQSEVKNASKIVQDLLWAVKTKQVYISFKNELASLSPQKLAEELQEDAQKIAFWINLYNAYIQIILLEQPSLAKNKKVLFSYPQFVIAGQRLSFDEVEHGILRRSKIKYGFGYLSNRWVSDFEKKHRVSKVDARLHFALNCGAESCPPIAFYDAAKLDQQLDFAAHGYLEQNTEYDATKNKVKITKLMLWFRGDFKNRKGILDLLKKYQIIPQNAKPRFEYKPYKWDLKLDYFE